MYGPSRMLLAFIYGELVYRKKEISSIKHIRVYMLCVTNEKNRGNRGVVSMRWRVGGGGSRFGEIIENSQAIMRIHTCTSHINQSSFSFSFTESITLHYHQHGLLSIQRSIRWQSA